MSPTNVQNILGAERKWSQMERLKSRKQWKAMLKILINIYCSKINLQCILWLEICLEWNCMMIRIWVIGMVGNGVKNL